MRPVTPDFLRVIRGSHRMCARATIVPPGQTGVTPVGTEIPIESGTVVQDANANIRSTVDLSTLWDWPNSANDLVTPYGNEVFIERGIVFGNGSREWVSQGYFRLYSVEQEYAPNGLIRISGRDRMSGIIDARLETPIQFAVGTTFSDIVEFLVHSVYPGLPIEYDFAAENVALTTSHIAEEDRYAFLLDLVRSQGKVMFFDYEGKLQIKTAPDPSVPVFEVAHGHEGVLVSMSRALGREGVFNAVVSAGETPGNTLPVHAIARDENPNSATYYFGPFGKVPRFYSSPFITTAAQARTAASAMLVRSLGLPYNVDFTAVPNPALEPLDPVLISYSDRFAPESHIIETLRTPLTASGVMTATTREQTTIEIGVS